MIKLVDNEWFESVDKFQLNNDGSVQFYKGTSNGPIFDGLTVEYDNNTFDVWAKFCELRDNGTITVQPVPQSELDAIAAEQAKQALDAQKRAGQSINGHTISLTEENQNGLAAVMQGAQLADESGTSIFPLNFNARTESGEVSIPFANKADYEAFCLAFLQARQQFF